MPTPARFGFLSEVWRLRVADFAVLVTLTNLAPAPLSPRVPEMHSERWPPAMNYERGRRFELRCEPAGHAARQARCAPPGRHSSASPRCADAG